MKARDEFKCSGTAWEGNVGISKADYAAMCERIDTLTAAAEKRERHVESLDIERKRLMGIRDTPTAENAELKAAKGCMVGELRSLKAIVTRLAIANNEDDLIGHGNALAELRALAGSWETEQ